MTPSQSQMSRTQKMWIALGLITGALASLGGYAAYELSKFRLGNIVVYKEGVGPSYEDVTIGETN